MQYIKEKASGFQLARISLGSADFGGSTTESAAFRVMDAYIDRGGNFIDTAHVYADWIPGTHSSSEKIIGKWLRQSKKRDKMFIASKGAHPPLGDMGRSRMSASEIGEDISEGLQFTGIDYFDLYYLHRDDPEMAVGEIMENANEQIKAGKTRALGCSNWKADRIAEANRYCGQKGLTGFSASQILYSLAEPNDEALTDKTMVRMSPCEYDFYISSDILLTAYSSQAGGFFTKVANNAPISDDVKKAYFSQTNNIIFKKADEIAKKHGVSMTALALSYIYSQPFDSIAVIGCKTVEQVEDCLRHSDFMLQLENVKLLNSLKSLNSICTTI